MFPVNRKLQLSPKGVDPGRVGEREKLNVQTYPIKLCSTGGILLKVRDVIKSIEADGWYLVTTKGSHRQYKHPVKPGRITIAGHPSDDLAPGTLNSIFKQAKMRD